jgi:hypothetical protein
MVRPSLLGHRVKVIPTSLAWAWASWIGNGLV